MATAGTTLPPMGKISMIGIWIETALYGISRVTFFRVSPANTRMLTGVKHVPVVAASHSND